ncbi:MAG TPA: SDR family oxidoreductase [Burkholderiales bacterium]|nr:SDR family oxidoreductase [Burkholderiales bacterium]
MKRLLIVGATSAIAEATARRFAAKGARLFLVARNPERLRDLVSDLSIRGAASVDCAVLDANDFDRHEAMIDDAVSVLGGLDIALISHGTLGDQARCEKSFPLTLDELNTNAISVISLLTHLANRFAAQRRGSIAVVSSVAGDRGRASNYVYGAAKGAVTLFLQGLRGRLHRSGVHVLTIKPGFVDTPMTAASRKGPFWSHPERIAKGIERALEKRKDVAYLPFWWRLVMAVIKLIPEGLFKRTSL